MKNPLKILLLEDNAYDAEIVQRLLSRHSIHYECKLVMNKQEFLLALNSFEPDVILSDHSLPQFNSAEALQIARQQYPSIPFIMVTGAVSEEFAAEIIKAGADDYILKDRMARLPATINTAIKQRETEKRNHEIKEQAQQQISLAEERERIAIQATNIGIFDLDIITGTLITSQRCNEIFGFNETMPARDYLSLVQPDDIIKIDEGYETSKVTGKLSIEARVIKQDKSTAWVRAEGIIHKNKNGVPVRL